MRVTAAVSLCALLGWTAACSDSAGSAQAPSTVTDGGEQAAVAADGDDTVGVAAPPPPAVDGPTTTPAPGSETTFEVVDVPESGVPGIDSDDAFCAAWSRFGGSWQVIQVAANFADDPAVAVEMEVAAAPVIDQAYDAMFAAWPETLEAEREAVAEDFFGPLARRADAALEALDAVGATEDDLAWLATGWVAALLRRDLDDPVLLPDLDDERWALVEAAATDFAGRRVPMVDDPSMLITVATPLTDAYLASGCPDQGALAGAEVDGG